MEAKEHSSVTGSRRKNLKKVLAKLKHPEAIYC
jgi:hypothetical protein